MRTRAAARHGIYAQIGAGKRNTEGEVDINQPDAIFLRDTLVRMRAFRLARVADSTSSPARIAQSST